MPTSSNDSPYSAKPQYYLLVLFSLLAAVLGVACSAGASSEAAQWFDKMVQAARRLNYDGTFVYRSGNQLESMRIIRSVDPDGNPRERLISLSGVAWEVLRDGSQVTCILPKDRAVVVGKSRQRSFLSSPVFTAPEQRSQHYQFSLAGTDRVAGRPTESVRVTPVDQYRYGFRLWVDHETGLLLKSELTDDRGVPLEQFVYTSIQLPEHVPDTLLQPGISGSGFTWYTHEKKRREATDAPQPSAHWRVTWLPLGFLLSDRASDSIPKRQVSVERLVYSDGLSSFLVLIELLGSAAEGQQGLSQMGAVTAFGRLIDGFQITVLGEVPPITVEKVALSIQRNPS